jgi:hypothetical protein
VAVISVEPVVIYGKCVFQILHHMEPTTGNKDSITRALQNIYQSLDYN